MLLAAHNIWLLNKHKNKETKQIENSQTSKHKNIAPIRGTWRPEVSQRHHAPLVKETESHILQQVEDDESYDQ